VIVYVTLFLFVLGILFIALGIDVGWMAYVRSQGQAAVDSAAISGAAAIPAYNSGDPSVVYSIVGSLNSQNTVMNQDAAIANTDVEFCTGDPDLFHATLLWQHTEWREPDGYHRQCDCMVRRSSWPWPRSPSGHLYRADRMEWSR